MLLAGAEQVQRHGVEQRLQRRQVVAVAADAQIAAPGGQQGRSQGRGGAGDVHAVAEQR